MMTSEELDKVKSEAEAENRRLRQEMLDSAEEYSRKIAQLEEIYENKLRHLEEQKDMDIRVRIVH